MLLATNKGRVLPDITAVVSTALVSLLFRPGLS